MTKQKQLLLVIAVILILGGSGSLIAKKFFFTEKEVIRLALVAPTTGVDAVTGRSMQEGAKLAVEQLNANRDEGEKEIVITVFNDNGDAKNAKKIANEIVEQGDFVAVIGHSDESSVVAASPIYERNKIPLITFATGGRELVENFDWSFKTSLDSWQQARFLANYTKNVLKQNIVTIVHENTTAGREMARGFEETYRRFGTRIRFTWSFDPGESRKEVFAEVAKTLQEKKDNGLIFLAMSPVEAAHFVKYARRKKLKNRLVGPDALVSHNFINKLQSLSGDYVATLSNNILVISSLLWDTAGQKAQNYHNAYQRKYRHQSDVVGANSFDAVMLSLDAIINSGKEVKSHKKGLPGILETLQAMISKRVEDSASVHPEDESLSPIEQSRYKIFRYLKSLTSFDKAFNGVNGSLFFDKYGEVQKNMLIGQYDGSQLISAMTQLMPITAKGKINYINEIKNGRMLYVNDRFMYKANVIYSGIALKNVANINKEDNTADMTFSIWFRYRGSFDPGGLQIINAVGDVKFGDPVEELRKGDITFKLYNVTGKFRMNYSDTIRPYGSQVFGVSFRHKSLSRNNIILVVDILGIDIGRATTLPEKIQDSRVIDPSLGWAVDKAWYSSETTSEDSLGRPQFVGFGTESPTFSRIDFGVMISGDSLSLRDIVPAEYFIYLGIFAVVGILFGIGIDSKTRNIFWSITSYFLYLVFWPILLLSLGNIVLDFAVNNLPLSGIDSIVRMYEIIWWFLPAVLINIAIDRFVWKTMERHSGQIVPNIIRKVVAFLFYTFAFLGVIAFVYGQTLTSLLATGGLFTMIIGLALQADISNIFSGIIVNFERPFSVGDWIKIGNLEEAQVIDITWRTIRLQTDKGHILSVPNGMVSGQAVVNYSVGGAIQVTIPISVGVSHPPDEILALINEVCETIPRIAEVQPYECIYKGVKNVYRQWVAAYEINYWLDDYTDETITMAIWGELYQYFSEHNIRLDIGSEEGTGGDNGFEDANEEDWKEDLMEEIVL